MPPKNKGKKGKPQKSITGLPALIVLDVSDNGGPEPTLDRESIRLWIISNCYIYISEDDKPFEQYLTSYQGCLTYPELRTNKYGQKFRIHIPLNPKSKKKIYFTTIWQDPNLIEDRQKVFFNGAELKINFAERESVPRPYVDFLTKQQISQGEDFFKKGIFNKGLNYFIVKSKNIEYPIKAERVLDFWEYFIYKNSFDKRIRTYNDIEGNGVLSLKYLEDNNVNGKPRDGLKKLLDNKRGNNIASFSMRFSQNVNKTTSTTIGLGYGSSPFHSSNKHLFAYSKGKDTMRQIRIPEEEEQAEIILERTQMIEGNFSLYKMDRKNYEVNTTPYFTALNNFDITKIRKTWMKDFLEKNQEQRDIISKMNELELEKYLISTFLKVMNLNFDQKYNTIFSKLLFCGYGEHLEIAKLRAIQEAISTFHSSNISEGMSHVTLKLLDKKYFYAVKKIFFETSSDAFSEDIIPRHIYFQINEWMNLLEAAEKKILTDCDEIEVWGFSSKCGSKSLNQKLRERRAWKTFKCLECFNEFKKKKITHKAAPIDEYPNNDIFNYSRFIDFTLDVADPDSISIEEMKSGFQRKITNDDENDRVSLILFKTKKPENVESENIVLHLYSAYPIFEYQTLYETLRKNEDGTDIYYVFMYVHVGHFNDI